MSKSTGTRTLTLGIMISGKGMMMTPPIAPELEKKVDEALESIKMEKKK